MNIYCKNTYNKCDSINEPWKYCRRESNKKSDLIPFSWIMIKFSRLEGAVKVKSNSWEK